MKAQGYATITLDGVITKERDTHTCAHCNCVIHVPPKKFESVADFCRNCMKVICLKPQCHTCTPFLKKLEALDKQDPAHAVPFDQLFPPTDR